MRKNKNKKNYKKNRKYKISRKNRYDVVWLFNDTYVFDLYEDLDDFMKKNHFDCYFIVGGDDPMKNYVIFGKYKRNFRNFIIFLTNRGK